MIVYSEATQKWAISLARDFRSKGKTVEMVKRTDDKKKEDYIAFGKRGQAISMLYLQDDISICMINLLTGAEKIVDCRKK